MSLDYIAPELQTLARPVAELKEDPDNVNVHDKHSLSSVRNSLERFGQRIPIVVRNGVVIAGNARLAAAKKLGWTHIACVSADDDDDQTALLFSLVDNKKMSSFDQAGLAEVLATLNDKEALGKYGWTGPELQSIFGSLKTDLPELKTPESPPKQTEPGEQITDLKSPTPAPEPEVDPGKLVVMSFTVHESQYEQVTEAIKAAKQEGGAKSEVNPDSDGNALHWISKVFLGV